MIYIREANFDDFEKEWLLVRSIPTDENGYINRWYGISRKEFDKALYMMIEEAEGIGLKPGYVPETTFFIWNDLEMIGQAKLRHYLTDSLRKGSGHIGYWISPQYRGRGYGTEALRQLLKYAENVVPEKEFYLRADKSNDASVKVMLKNGGRVVGEKNGKVFVRIAKPDWWSLERNNTVLRDMTDAEKKDFTEKITKHFAEALAENQAETKENSLAAAAGILDEIMADESAEHCFKTADTGGNVAGYIWYKLADDEVRYAYTVYLYVEAGYRGKGFGGQILKLAEKEAAESGCKECRLCVWESNWVARRLYEGLGYVPRETTGRKTIMMKKIGEE